MKPESDIYQQLESKHYTEIQNTLTNLPPEEATKIKNNRRFWSNMCHRYFPESTGIEDIKLQQLSPYERFIKVATEADKVFDSGFSPEKAREFAHWIRSEKRLNEQDIESWKFDSELSRIKLEFGKRYSFSIAYHWDKFVEIATNCGNVAILKCLIAEGGEQFENNVQLAKISLKLPCQQGYLTTVVFLLGKGTRYPSNNKETLLISSCKSKNFDLVKLLLGLINIAAANKGKELSNTQCSQIKTLLYSRGKYLERDMSTQFEIGPIVNSLNFINEVDEFGNTPLIEACRQGSLEIVELLFKNGANPNVQNKRGETPLHWACVFGNLNFVTLLIKNGASVKKASENTSSNINSNSNVIDGPLVWLCEGKPTVEVADLLIQEGAQINDVNQNGDTPLHLACTKENIPLVRLFLKKGAQVNTVNQQGDSALHSACASGNVRLVTLLLTFGAKSDIKNKQGQTSSDLARDNLLKSADSVSTIYFQVPLAQYGNPAFSNIFKKLSPAQVDAIKNLMAAVKENNFSSNALSKETHAVFEEETLKEISKEEGLRIPYDIRELYSHYLIVQSIQLVPENKVALTNNNTLTSSN